MKRVKSYLLSIFLGGLLGGLVHLIFHGITEVYLARKMADDPTFFLNKLSYLDLVWLHHFVYGVDAALWILVGMILGIIFIKKGLINLKRSK
ncbi:MAG: hypothetical protein GTN40_01655 [Candidatus Aenigmarchaeota archaeon]|nr:hypothetical protein [Candidatus Aenigmarchaeota archaeon]